MAGLPKFDGPLAPVPSWLDPDAEVKSWAKPAWDRTQFIVNCVDAILHAGHAVDAAGACEITANAVVETGAKYYKAFNLGGVKATPAWAQRYAARTGRPAPFFRAHGNKGTGDSHTVIYRGYSSLADFWDEWLRTFVPRNLPSGIKHLYRKTGDAFWAQPRGDWFRAMCAAGYKGPVTAKSPERSIKLHHQLTREVRTRYAQHKLGVVVDNKWGPKSIAACKAFQRIRALPETGEVDDATLEAFAALP